MKSLTAIFILVAASLTALAQPELTFMADGKQVSLSPIDANRIIKEIDEIVRSANFNSRDHAFFPFKNADYWRPISEISNGSYIRISYPSPHIFRTVGGEIAAKEVWLDLPHERIRSRAMYPGPITLINGEDKILLTFESGYLVVQLGRSPAIYPHLPKIIKETLKSDNE